VVLYQALFKAIWLLTKMFFAGVMGFISAVISD